MLFPWWVLFMQIWYILIRAMKIHRLTYIDYTLLSRAHANQSREGNELFMRKNHMQLLVIRKASNR